MKITVIVYIPVETEQYFGAQPNREEAINLVKAMIKGEADFPPLKEIKIATEE